MYLVHAHLRRPAQGGELPSDLRALVYESARPEDGVEHVSVHADESSAPVLGLFLTAGSLAQAEEHAAAVCTRLLRTHPELSGWILGRAEAPLLVID
ncbi:hypothetical protein OHA37_08155 [Streptomyces sp. NBC_00335]|uniref:hypothetical protein n=1 Tax=unclassified Streptomyces TaxID=2593676 RepID=UPI0022583D7F|nr:MULTISPECIES: hypothetical protein [unclassified Streptomyces]MCX5403855.1 hypothetical protein [Streptomyces sp. NBC_00086]